MAESESRKPTAKQRYEDCGRLELLGLFNVAGQKAERCIRLWYFRFSRLRDTPLTQSQVLLRHILIGKHRVRNLKTGNGL
jgi:hypothetical protein